MSNNQKSNEMQTNDSENNLDAKNDTSSTSTDKIDDKQQQNTQNNDKYNISNVLKHIYALKHVQKTNENKCLSS